MNRYLSCMLSLLLCPLLLTAADKDDLKAFTDAKFGLFIHWGLYSHTAGEWKGHPTQGGEHFMLYERIPLKEYATIADQFNPTGFNARKWAREARRAGMRYVVVTAKHHDGFAMYQSDCNDYNIVKRTPFARDPMAELAEACRREGLKFGFYYSLGRDWEDPDVPTNWPEKGGRSNTWDYPDEDAKDLQAYIDRKVIPQLTELLTHYGRIDFLWFDTPELVTRKQSQTLRELINRLQPHCLINSRIGNGLGDYRIVEQRLMEKIDPHPWEACLTMGANWGYNRYDTVYKKPDILVRHLVDVVSKGGNLLLNIGPDPKGNFPSLTRPGLRTYRHWLHINGEAIYHTSPWHVYGEPSPLARGTEEIKTGFHDAVFDGTPAGTLPDFRYTCREQTVYVIVRHVPEDHFLLRSFRQGTDRVARVSLLGGGKKVDWEQTPDGLAIRRVSRGRNAFPVYVLKVELER